MYRCKIVYSDDDITIIRSKRILFLLFLLPVVFLMLFVLLFYNIFIEAKHYISCCILLHYLGSYYSICALLFL